MPLYWLTFSATVPGLETVTGGKVKPSDDPSTVWNCDSVCFCFPFCFSLPFEVDGRLSSVSSSVNSRIVS